MKNLLRTTAGLAMLCSILLTHAQEYPYPRNVKYSYGYMSSNITTNDSDAEYQGWINEYYTECSADEARIDYNGNTVSEGIGYGLIITAYAGDKTKFDKLWNYYAKRVTGNGVMHWEFSGCQTSPKQQNGATDGDLDAAMGLLVAVHQWPGSGYETKFESLANGIKSSEFMDCGGLIIQKPGDAWGGCDCSNPSYYAPGYYRAFAAYYEEKGDANTAGWWNKAADDSYIVLFKNQNASTGLVSAWTNSSGAAGPCGGAVGGGGGADTYQYDACRTPWRIATDYLWWGNSDAEKFLTRVVSFVNTGIGGIENTVDGYKLDGTETGQWHNVPFVGSFALSGMATSKSDADKFMKHFATIKGDNYFNTCLAVMYKFLATGNFWNPYDVPPPVPCSQVDLGSETSLCGQESLELNAGVGTHNDRTYTWYRNDTELLSSGKNTFSVNQEGTYKVVLDSAGMCSSEAKVFVSASIPDVDLGDKVFIGGETILDAKVEGDGIVYTWYLNDQEIPGQTQKTLSITEEGTYKVELSATGCASVSDDIIAEKLPYINRTSNQIAIDGTADADYVKFRPLETLLSGAIGAPDLAASWSGLWDNSNLYIFVKVTDNDLQNDSGDSWYFDDGVEIFVDGDDSKNHTYDNQNDFQWGFVWDASSIQVGGNSAGNATAGVDYTISETDNGYNLEVAIPWSTIGVSPQEGATIGFDAAVNDDDGGAERENKISWNATEDDAWQNPSLLASVSLAGEASLPTEKQTIQLKKGWNLIAVNIQAANPAISAVMPNISIVKTLDKFYDKSLPSFINSLEGFVAGQAYLVYTESAHQVVIEGTRVVPQPTLKSGWNIIASPVTAESSLEDAFGSELNNIEVIKTFDTFWENGGFGTITIMPDTAYFVKRK